MLLPTATDSFDQIYFDAEDTYAPRCRSWTKETVRGTKLRSMRSTSFIEGQSTGYA